MTQVIHTENLTKHYGDVQAAEAINLDINEGEIYGFLGWAMRRMVLKQARG